MRNFVEFMTSSLLDSDLNIERNTLFSCLNGFNLSNLNAILEAGVRFDHISKCGFSSRLSQILKFAISNVYARNELVMQLLITLLAVGKRQQALP